jgi:6,7-dimethyl-8-ribityllumazine synthase
MATTNNNLSDYNMEEVSSSESMRFAIIVSEWNNHITENLFVGAEQTLIKSGVKQNDIIRIDVPGSFELVFGAKIAQKKNIILNFMMQSFV